MKTHVPYTLPQCAARIFGMLRLAACLAAAPRAGAVDYFVNDDLMPDDQFCTAPGNDGNDGLSAAAPLRSPAALLSRYTPVVGDTLYIDSGTYALTQDLELPSTGPGDPGSGPWLRVIGTGQTVLDRLNPGAESCCVRVRQDCTRIEGLICRKAGTGIRIHPETCRNAVLEQNTLTANTVAGVAIGADPGSEGHDTYTLRNNLCHNNPTGIDVQGGDGFHLAYATLENNTIVVYNGNGVVCGGRAGGMTLRNNIISVKGDGACLAITQAGAIGSSDFNNLHAYGEGRIAQQLEENTLHLFSTLSAWRAASGFDYASLNRDPLFVQPETGNFHLSSREGSWRKTGWAADPVTSPCLDAGDPSSPIGGEPAPNGNRVNLGAFGGTPEASLSEPGRTLTLLAPLGGESWSGDGVTVAWNGTGAGWSAEDTVRLEWAVAGTGSYTFWETLPDASALAPQGRYVWHPPANGTASYLLRVVCNADAAVSAMTAQAGTVVRQPRTYYVNDASVEGDLFCAGPGNDGNTGQSTNSPLPSLQKLLAQYTLQPGDTVYADTGLYNLDSNVVIDAQHSGSAELPVTLIGARGGTRLIRSANGSDRCCLDVKADHLRIGGFACESAEIGIRIQADAARHVRLTANRCRSNSVCGIQITPMAGGYGEMFQLLQNVVTDNGAGLYLQGDADVWGGRAQFLIENNTIRNTGHAVYLLNGNRVARRINVLKNNILVATGGESACIAALIKSVHYSDYNVLRAPNGSVGHLFYDPADPDPTPLTDLSLWRTATGGQDSHSLSADPLFVSPAQDDFRLRSDSPCADAGVISFWMAGLTDPDGQPRVAGVTVDIGAYELNVRVSLRLLLQGPFQGYGPTYLMSPALSESGVLPLTSPYADDPRRVTQIPQGVTDWVLLQFRRAPAAPSLLTTSAFLRQDGWVVGEDGSTNLVLNLPRTNTYHVVVKHRNHLAAMSAQAVGFSDQALGYDFTTGPGKYFGGESACAEVSGYAGTFFALRAGDVDGDGRVGAADGAVCLSMTGATASAYRRSDVTLDGSVTFQDDWTPVAAAAVSNSVSPVPNPGTALTGALWVKPSRATLAPGGSLALTCPAYAVSNTSAAAAVRAVTFNASNDTLVAWQFAQTNGNSTLTASGAAAALYTAGTVTGVTDVVTAWDSAERIGRAFLNVVGTQTVAAAGQALILAGRTSESDPLWPATEYLADTAYTTLRYRGFSKETIHYFSPEPLQDVDGNGEWDDIDGAATLAAAAHAFTNTVTGANRLLVYLVDHGGFSSGEGYFRLSNTNTLSATQLDAWLDALQDRDQTPVTVLLDFCYAGSFLPALTYTGTAERIVIAACGAAQPSYFVSGGLVSYSAAFFTGVMLGYDVLACHEMAQNAMGTYQTAMLDDDHDGADTEGDGDVAHVTVIGPTGVAAGDMPQIGEACGNQVLADGTSATLWIGSVTGPHPIAEAWCHIVPPGYDPDPDQPVTALPRCDLAYDTASGHYTVTYDGFTAAGTYPITFYVRDIEDNVSPPRTVYISQVGFDDRAILVAGCATNSADWPAVRYLTQLAYDTLRLRLFTPDRIRVLAPVAEWDLDGDGTNDVAGLAGTGTFHQAITEWAGTQPTDRLTFLLLGQGVSNALCLTAEERLSANALADRLHAYQSTNPIPVNLILDFSGAGAFIPALADPELAANAPEATRIVMASAHPGRAALFANNGTVSFSQYLLSGVIAGKTLGDAYTDARRAIRRISGNTRQRAQIDDNLNGEPSEKDTDGALADETYLGFAFVTGADAPVIGSVTPRLVCPGGPVTLWAAGIAGMHPISNVWCVITPPGQTGTGDLPSVSLTWNALSERYEAEWDGMTQPGLYTLTFLAADTAGQVSDPVQSEGILADAYEPDDRADQAALYDGDPQIRTLHATEDEDWVRVFLLQDWIYDIETYHFSEPFDTMLELYREMPAGSLERINQADEEGSDSGEFLGIDYPETGWYWVRVLPFREGTNTLGGYELSIDVPAADGAGALIVLAVDDVTLGALPAGSYASVTGQGDLPFNGSKNITFTGLPYGTYQVTVPLPAHHIAREDPSTPGQVQSLTNTYYANPRQVVISGSWRLAGFELLSTLAVTSAVVRDAYTHAFLPEVRFAFTAASGALTGQVAEGSVLLTDYADAWLSGADGRAPSNIVLGACDWDLALSLAGYQTSTVAAAVSNLPAGASAALGTLYLIPADTNANTVADAWEALHFPDGLDKEGDADEDGLSNYGEYLCGTLPHDASSVLSILDAAADPSAAHLTWAVTAGRTYTVEAFETLGGTPVTYGPWEATTGQTLMQWNDPDTSLYATRFYRVRLQEP